MKFGQNDFDSRFPFLFDNARGDAAAVVRNANRTVFEYFDDDMRAIARKCFVDGVVHDFGHKVMKSANVRRAYIHTRTLSDGIESFENLNITRIVTVFDFF